jgi:putrescine transport system permease protein
MKTIFSFVLFEKNKKEIGDVCNKIVSANFIVKICPILWLSVFFVIPLLIVLKTSFAESTFSVPPYSAVFVWIKEHYLQVHLNLHNYFVLFKNTCYKMAFLNSIMLSTISTVVCLIIGYMTAYAVFTIRGSAKHIMLLLITLSFWISILIKIYSWINLLSTSGLVNLILMKIGFIDTPIQFLGNYYIVCVGIIFCYLPFAILPIYSSMMKIDRFCIEAASDLGANPFKTFWMVTIPQTIHGIIAGGILVFSTSVGEFVIPELLGGPETITIGRVLWIEFFNNIDWPMACALSVVLSLFIIFPIFLFQQKSGNGLENINKI